MSTPEAPSLLVVGAAPGSLGAAVAKEAQEWDFFSVVTAGINNEDVKLDVTHSLRVREVLDGVQPDVVVCTVGVNNPAEVQDPYLPMKLHDSFTVNVVGPLELLRHFTSSVTRPERIGLTKKFVAISSNSARIPRRHSVPYCATKAALSMGLRVAARELAGKGVQVWGYEPGLLAGTPMTKETEAKFGSASLHRMKGVYEEGIPVSDLAWRILQDVAGFSVALNGVVIPFDAGEI